MEKRLKNYLKYIEEKIREIKGILRDGNEDESKSISKNRNGLEVGAYAEAERVMKDLLIQIGFFAHERLVHLIVTVTFAILTVVAVVGFLISEQVGLIALIVLLLVLLVPYIRHYYILENGVQKLYTFYDELQKILSDGK